MRVYETIFVLDPALEDHVIQKEVEKVEQLITNQKGRIIKSEKWGKRQFCYPIKKRMQGYYTLIYFEGEENIPGELERSYKLNESCLRYLTVLSEEKTKQVEAEEKEENKVDLQTKPSSSE